MSLVTRMLKQYAVLWTKVGQDNFNNPTISAPVEIICRWEIDRRETKDAKGNTITLSAIADVAQEIPVGSLLWQGRITSLTGTGDAANPNDDLHVVISNHSIPDLKGVVVQRTVWMMRYSKQLPTVVS